MAEGRPGCPHLRASQGSRTCQALPENLSVFPPPVCEQLDLLKVGSAALLVSENGVSRRKVCCTLDWARPLCMCAGQWDPLAQDSSPRC